MSKYQNKKTGEIVDIPSEDEEVFFEMLSDSGELDDWEDYKGIYKEPAPTQEPYQQRREQFGRLADVFPYLATAQQNGVKFPNNIIAGVKDVASLPGRYIASLGAQPLGRTSEESASRGFLGPTESLVRSPWNAFAFYPAGTAFNTAKSMIGAGAATGAALGLNDAMNRQQGYESGAGDTAIETGLAAALGAAIPASALFPLRSALNKVVGATNVTWQQLKALVNRVARGSAGSWDDYTTAQYVLAHPNEVATMVDNATREGAIELQNSTAASMRDFGERPLNVSVKDAEYGTDVRPFMYQGSKKSAGKYRSAEEKQLGEQLAVDMENVNIAGTELRAAEDGLTAEAARTNLNNASEAVNDTRAALSSEGKSHRGLNMVRGEYDRVVQNPSDKAQRMTTNDATADFFDTWRKSVDETAPKMAATWKTEGRNRMNRNGSSFTPTDDKAGTEEYKYIDAMFERVRARDAMYRKDPINNPPPSVTNEDVVNVLRQMADNNQSEYMDDLLNACKWLSPGDKESIKRSVTLNKFATNATGARLPSRNDGIIDKAIDIYQARKAPIATIMGNNIPAGNIVPKNFASNVDKLGGSTEMAHRIVFGNKPVRVPVEQLNIDGLLRFGPIMVRPTKDYIE